MQVEILQAPNVKELAIQIEKLIASGWKMNGEVFVIGYTVCHKMTKGIYPSKKNSS